MAETDPATVAETVAPTDAAPDDVVVIPDDGDIFGGADFSKIDGDAKADAAETPGDGDAAAASVTDDAPADPADSVDDDDDDDVEAALIDPDADEKPAAADDKPAAPDPAKVEADKRAVEAFHAWERDYANLKAKVAAEGFDVIENADDANKAFRVLFQGLEYARHGIEALDEKVYETTATTREASQWDAWAKANPGVEADRGRKMWGEELKKAAAAFPGKGDDVHQAVALTKFNARVKLVQGKLKAAAPPPATPPAAKKPAPVPPRPTVKPPGRVLPGGRTTPPPPAVKPDSHELAKVGKAALMSFP